MMQKTLLLALALQGLAHPGEDHSHELAARKEYLSNNRVNLRHCQEKLAARGVLERSLKRRGLAAQRLQTQMGSEARAVDVSVFATNASCVLSPEEILGPYFVAGEYVRQNLVEDQKGIPLTVDVQFIDSATCEPVAGKYVEIWGANATGVYGGVLAEENGSGLADPANLSKTWLRGVQKSDHDGVVQFDTILPGRYTGRTNHLHVLVHPNAVPFDNGTVLSTESSFVGQLYFPQDLVDEAQTRKPYSDNQQPQTTNAEDQFLQGDLQAGGHPIVDYHRVGGDLQDGLVAWLAYGIDTAKRETVQPTHTYDPKETAYANSG